MNTPTFATLGVRAPLVRALTAAGIAAPFPIQADTLPDSLAGRDVLGRGRTGSGKTLAFSIPMVDRLGGELAGRRMPNRPVGLVLAPTRELATQIATAIEPLAGACGMTVTTIFGGVSQHRQVQALKRGVDIVIACPGRLEDLMKQGLISLDAVEVTVIDEADHMADLGFLPGVTRILAATPEHGQRLLFSATLDNGVNKLVKRFLPNAVLHSVDDANSPVADMTHHVFEVSSAETKRAVVHRLASGTGRRILFTRTKHQARKLAKQLTTSGIPAVDLHGNLNQPARDRNLATFASGAAKVLVATDVAARGVHVDGVELVVHVDPPAEHKAYLHRSGRTARAGNAGDVITLVMPDQRGDLAALMRKAKIDVTPQRVTADSPAVIELVGEVAPLVAISDPAPARQPKAAPASKSARTNASRRNDDDTASRGRRRSRTAPEAFGAERPGRRSSSQGSETYKRSARHDGDAALTKPGTRGGRKAEGSISSRPGVHPATGAPRGTKSDKRGGRAEDAAHANSAARSGRKSNAGSATGRPARANDSANGNGNGGGSARQRTERGNAGSSRQGGRGAAPAGSNGGLAGFSRSGAPRRRRTV
ncbi:DEAD/DEAH box helicase [Nocardia concava]|uniref:DEAD/DEAH box helicase n=1 Tax=Nocardia concava TaxID=257281 RepID=UPI000318F4EC|nr:DEAD/DEAH box helicase [Nocardia concava]